jgi:transcriptional regulator with XRE-family HTH domain
MNKHILDFIQKHGPDKAAKVSGYSRSTLYSWARGARKPDPNLLKDISKRLGIPRQKLRPDLYED